MSNKPSNIQYRDERGVRILKYRRFHEGEDYDPVDPDEVPTVVQSMKDSLELHRKRIGQPPKYETVDEFYSIVDAYYQYIQDANIDKVKLIPDIEGLCSYMGISRETLNTWEHTRNARYSDAIKIVKNQIAFFKKQMALKGKIPPIVFATDFNNNHGYTQKQEVTVIPKNPLGDNMSPEEVRKLADSLPAPSDCE
jgi:hypothetical protein